MNFHRNCGRFCVSELHQIRLSRSLRSLRFERNKVYGPVWARNWYKYETKSIYIIDKNLHRRRDQRLSSNGIHRHTRNLISKGNGNSLELHRSKLVRSVLIIKQSHTARYILFPTNKLQFRITVLNQSGFAKITYFVGGRAFYRWKKQSSLTWQKMAFRFVLPNKLCRIVFPRDATNLNEIKRSMMFLWVIQLADHRRRRSCANVWGTSTEVVRLANRIIGLPGWFDDRACHWEKTAMEIAKPVLQHVLTALCNAVSRKPRQSCRRGAN